MNRSDQKWLEMIRNNQQLSKKAKVSSSNSLSVLYNITTKNPQFTAADFSKLSNFPYSEEVNSKNINLSTFAFGSIKHLLALSDGTLPQVSKSEFLNRLRHLSNVFEICCEGSSQEEFQSYNWKVSRWYNNLGELKLFN